MTDETPDDIPVTELTEEHPAPPAAPAAGGGGGGGWNYGYGGLWTPPPEPPAHPQKRTRRALAALGIAVLVLVSGSIGAVISAAVNDNSAPPAASPFIDGSNNTPFGSNPITPNTTSTETSAIASKVSPALVNIYTTIETPNGRGQAAGTGMVISSSGEVLTNNHVIADSSTIRVELVSTGDMHTAEVVGYDVKHDVALLQIDDVSDLDTVSFADADQLEIGDPVVAIGNAGGRGGDPAVTSGSVTAKHQKVTAGDQGGGDVETLVDMIEISAPIEPGDSGGPLVNAKGEVIGMNTAAATGGRFAGQVSSTAFAIPSNRALSLARQIRAGEESATVHVGKRGLLGVRVQALDADNAASAACNVTADSGAFVVDAQSDSPANSAGIGECDVIVGIGDKTVATTKDLNDAMFPYHPDDVVSVRWVDESGDSHRADLKLIAGPPA
jgi:S1-C subfamily serine protease